MGTEVDITLLRVVVRAVLGNIDELVGEGLPREAVAALRHHATALITRDPGARDDPGTPQVHGLGLAELLSELHGPVSVTLMVWLDDARGRRPPAPGYR